LTHERGHVSPQIVDSSRQ